jgi:alpha-aminoadipic semialdehyde synthase
MVPRGHASSKGNKAVTAQIGIRLEDKNQWETRAPLVPLDVKGLADDGIDIRVQRFPRRAFPDDMYEAAGATLVDEVGDCDLVLGVKEIPLQEFREHQAYMFFSHTIKGQQYNMKMLAELVRKRCSLLEYETVKDGDGRRLIFFGRHAGIAGAVDTLWTLGQRLEALGQQSPFLDLQQCRHYSSLDLATEAVKSVGERLADGGIPSFLAPLVIGVTGYGNVSCGAQEIFDLLPTVEVDPDDLHDFVSANETLTDRVVKVVYKERDLVEPIDPTREFELQDYYKHGADYKSKFGPHLELLTVLVNGIYWDERYPKLADEERLRDLFSVAGSSPRLLVVGDITCDIDGALACTVRDTEPGDPCYVYDPETRVAPSGFEGPGLAVMAIGNLPCELPSAASEVFSTALTPFVGQMALADWGESDFSKIELPEPIKRSVILWHGGFTPAYKYMEEYLR